MRVFIFWILLLVSFNSAAGQYLNKELRAELLAMEKSDQDARIKCAAGDADFQIRCLESISKTIDAPNTRRLEAIFKQYGFPDTKLVEKEGFQAFLILLQHSTSDDLREKSLKPIRRAFRRKELPPLDYANFVDRLRLRQGKAQLYGSGFEIKDGKLVLNKSEDIKNLDKRRVALGLPPLSEHVKTLKEMYHLEVEIPKIQ